MTQSSFYFIWGTLYECTKSNGVGCILKGMELIKEIRITSDETIRLAIPISLDTNKLHSLNDYLYVIIKGLNDALKEAVDQEIILTQEES